MPKTPDWARQGFVSISDETAPWQTQRLMPDHAADLAERDQGRGRIS